MEKYTKFGKCEMDERVVEDDENRTPQKSYATFKTAPLKIQAHD